MTWDRARSNLVRHGPTSSDTPNHSVSVDRRGFRGVRLPLFLCGGSERLITVAAGLMGCAGLYWLWDEYINPARDRRTEANVPTCRRSCLTSLPCRNHRPSLTTPLLTTLLLTQVLLTRLRAGRLGGHAIPISTESGSAATCGSVGRGMVRRDSAEAARRLSVTARYLPSARSS